MSARALLARTRRLELSRGHASPFERDYGSFEAFEAEVRASIDAGDYDRHDMPVVLASLRRWHDERAWAQ